jgi:hypothetical protein
MGGGVISKIFVFSIASSLRMVSRKPRMFAEKMGQGTYSVSPSMAASFAPMKIVNRRVGAAPGDVARWIIRVKSSLRWVDV